MEILRKAYFIGWVQDDENLHNYEVSKLFFDAFLIKEIKKMTLSEQAIKKFDSNLQKVYNMLEDGKHLELNDMWFEIKTIVSTSKN